MSSRRSLATLAVVLLILIAAVVALYAIRGQTPTTTQSTPSPTATAAATAISTTTNSPVPTSTSASPGAITGRFAYGSDFVPPATVYAISTTDPRVRYSVGFSGFGNPPRPTLPPGVSQPTYTITGVAPGTYWVVAYRTDGQLPDPGYYSRQAECTRTTPAGPCPDVTLVPATVISGQTTSGVDILTWGYPASNPPSPTIPPRP